LRGNCSKKAGLSGLFYLVGAIALMSTLIVAANAEPIAIDVVSAEFIVDRSGDPVIAIKMTEASKRVFAEFTSANRNRKVDFRVDGRTLMSTVIRDPIVGGTPHIFDPSLTASQVKALAERIATGRSKIEIEIAKD
jgi:preprotein translocase subunit SecD